MGNERDDTRMTHWGPTYYEMTHKPTAEELEAQAASARRHEAFPNVGNGEGKDPIIYQWALRRDSDNKIVVILDGHNEAYNFGPMGHCPEGYTLVQQALWPMPWEDVRI